MSERFGLTSAVVARVERAVFELGDVPRGFSHEREISLPPITRMKYQLLLTP